MSYFIMTLDRSIFFRLLAHSPEELQREAKESARRAIPALCFTEDDSESQIEIEEDLEAPGDSSETSFALNIVENALDWTLGLAVLQFIRLYVREKKLPKPFEVACSGRGDVFIVTSKGRVLQM